MDLFDNIGRQSQFQVSLEYIMMPWFDTITPFLILFTLLMLLWVSHWIILGRNADLVGEQRFPRQLVFVVMVLSSLLVFIFSLPISESSRNQLIGLIGLLVSGLIAFSSTNIVANLMAGIMLRMTTPFKMGDFIRVADHFGRVSERGLFDTEIQTETRELISLPNTYLMMNPVTTTRSSGTIISANVSLGYDIHHSQVEVCLLRAAKNAGLDDAFVHILELGDFSITYRVSGLLSEVKRLITVRSQLYQHMLDSLHADGIEIMSPSIMNQRRLPDDEKVIPEKFLRRVSQKKVEAEDIAFDKAEAAAELEARRAELENIIDELELTLKEAADENKQGLTQRLEEAREQLAALQDMTPDSH